MSEFTFCRERVFLPSCENGVDAKEYLIRYITKEFPDPVRTNNSDSSVAVYSIPKEFKRTGEKQANLAEELVFNRLEELANLKVKGLWITFFHSASYAGHSYRNQRIGKLMIREHDFVLFAKYEGKFHIAILEVKSTKDSNTNIGNLEKTSDAKVVKNNKRSAQHQLRDHIEILNNILNIPANENPIQNYIMWPFLGANTKDPKHKTIKRWTEDKNLHAFEDTILHSDKFNSWFLSNVLTAIGVEEKHFVTLLNRFIMLSCGVFVDEIQQGILALLTQEQLQLINSEICRQRGEGPMIVHGAAGTGKTLLVLRKLVQLYQTGQLNEQNKALYISYWPGIRCEMEIKLETLGIKQFVDTARFYVTTEHFLKGNTSSYKHIFMDEAEAICLAFQRTILYKTLSTIYEKYHSGNCTNKNCLNTTLEPNEDIREKIKQHESEDWGELWFTVDINQSVFILTYSPEVLKRPNISLTKVMRSTGCIFTVFKQFYASFPTHSSTGANMELELGHHIQGPPVFWVDLNSSIDKIVADIVIDLCASKGFKPNDLCVIPFLLNERLVPEKINEHIDTNFVENAFRPRAVGDVDNFLRNKEANDFLLTWVLKLKGLDFKVVIMAIDEDDFDINDMDDRKKAYILASRCSCLLILLCTTNVREDIDSMKKTASYPFCVNLNLQNNCHV